MTRQKIVVVGAGFAGVWTAAGVVREMELAGRLDEVEVTVVAPNDDLTVRPRLYEDDPQRMRVSLDRVLGPIGVRRLAATVVEVDTQRCRVVALDRQGEGVELGYDRLVLAAGSAMPRPEVPGDASEVLFDVDTLPAAARLHSHLAGLGREPERAGQFTAVVVGGGFTGLEIATELPARLRRVADGRPVRVLLVDRGKELAGPLGEGPRPVIARALDELGVEVRQATSVERVEGRTVTLSDGTELEAATVVWTTGMRASAVVEQVPGEKDRLGRLVVDEYLRVPGLEGVFATGDAAAARVDEEHTTMQACQHAVPLGKFAGNNVAAGLLGREMVAFDPDDYVTCLDLGPGHAVFTNGWEREVKLTGEEARQLKGRINGEWIYPPVDDRAAILDLADHRTTWPIDR